MKKKSIKYLILIILLTAISIIIPTIKVNAAKLLYSDFKTSKNLFCLNKGQRFTYEEEYTAIPFTKERQNIYFHTPNGRKENVLKYIITRSNDFAKPNIDDFVPQQAIWYLIRPGDYVPENNEAYQLIVEAIAYNQYCSVYKTGSVPQLIQEEIDSDKFYIYYTQVSTSAFGYTRIFKDLTNVRVQGATKTGTETRTDGYTVETTDGEFFYTHRDVYKKQSEADILKVDIKYEVGRRWNAELLETSNLRPKDFIEYYDSNNEVKFEKTRDELYMISGCSLEPCTKYTYNQYKELIGLGTSARPVDTQYVDDKIEIFEKNPNNFYFYVCCRRHYLQPFIIEKNGGNETYATLIARTPSTGTDKFWYFETLSSREVTKSIGVQDVLRAEGEVVYDEKSYQISLIKPVELSFQKQDFNSNTVPGAILTIEGINNVDSIDKSSITIGSDSVNIMPENGNSGTFTIKLTETAPTGYQAITERYLKVEYNNGKVTKITAYKDKAMKEKDTTYISSNNSTVTIKNQPILTNLKIVKTDLWQTNNGGLLRIPGVTFKIELTGVESMTGYSGTPSIVYATTDEDGEINLKGLVLAKDATEIKAKIIEMEVPDKLKHNAENRYYYIVDSTPIEMTITYNSNGSWSSNVNTVNGESISCDEPVVSGRNVSVTIKNQPYIDLAGKVWQDGQTGEKQVEDPNGIKNAGEVNLQGVEVGLYSIKDNQIIATKHTDKNGEYSFKYDLEQGNTDKVKKTPEGYQIVFSYDGINWEPTIIIKDKTTLQIHTGDINEDGSVNEKDLNRLEEYLNDWEITGTFNRDNADVNEDGKVNNFDIGIIRQYLNGWTIEGWSNTEKEALTSDATEDSNDRNEFNGRFKTISKGIATSTRGETTALGYTYNDSEKTSSLNVTMDGHTPGTTDKNFQISAKSQTYTESEYRINCGLVKRNFDLALTTNIENAEVTINGALTKYTDFKEPIIIKNNNPSSTTQKDNLYLYSSDYYYRKSDYKEENIEANIEGVGASQIAGEEIEVFVTYKVSLINQTYKVGNVDKFVYYYDSRYTLLEDESILNGYRINSNNNHIIEFEKIDKNTYMGDRIELILKFRVNKYDLNGDGTVEIDLGTYINAGEVTQYSSQEGGFIDRDSAPDNAEISYERQGNDIIAHDEDDSDQKVLEIQLKESETRKISGTVFGDLEENNGNKDDDIEDGIKGITVQLIELKKIGSQYYEYIWQETTTDENGYYQFTGFIPSGGIPNNQDVINYNYIVRFIYGDGVTGEIVRYNGQEYKSTIDTNYNKSWYNTSVYEEGASVARDNEARRLEVMAHSTTIDSKNGTALAIFMDERTFESLTESEKENIVEYYNSVVKPHYESVKEADEENDPENYIIATRIRNIFGDTLPDITAETMTEEFVEKIRKYVSFRTWMCAETSRINVQVDADDKTDIDSTEVPSSNQSLEFNNINFGLALRPRTEITLEKHITALKITPSGVGVESIVDAKATSVEKIVNGITVEVQGVRQGLSTDKSTISNRGFWHVETDVSELMQGADLEVEYTYVIKNDSEPDYLSQTLVDAYLNQDIKPYSQTLEEIKNTVRGTMRNGSYSYSADYSNNTIGTYLGHYYYDGLVLKNADVNADGRVNNRDVDLLLQYFAGYPVTIYKGDVDGNGMINAMDVALLQNYITGGRVDIPAITDDSGRVLVPSRVEEFEEALNNNLLFESEAGAYFEEVSETNTQRTVFNLSGQPETKTINTVVRNASVSNFLTPKTEENYTTETADWSKKIKLRTTLSTITEGEEESNIPSYIAEIVQYSNAAGTKDINATPGNLSYVHSDDTEMTMENSNEQDEFWGESIIITKPTGEDKVTSIQIVTVTTAAIATLGVGIILIKKFILKK